MAAVTLLSARGLSRNFDGLRAVHDVDFDLEVGEIRAVIGPNGAGKTTFVSLLCGRILPSAGRISFEGKDVTRLPAHVRVRLGIAYTFQITSVFGQLTCYDNVALAVQRRLLNGTDRRRAVVPTELRSQVLGALQQVGLADRGAQRAASLSYGHQRLLEIAMGLGLAPKLLILDEPTQGLSDGEIRNFIDLMRAIAGTSTILLIEHNMNVVMDLAQRITVLDCGSILAEGTPEAIRSDAAVQRAYLGG